MMDEYFECHDCGNLVRVENVEENGWYNGCPVCGSENWSIEIE
jgi:Zn finger protein HypA/HybF involved in hydrogenase expression